MPSDASSENETAAPSFDLFIDSKDVPKTGLSGEWRASEQECIAAARFLDVTAVSELGADYRATRKADGSIMVRGRITALVEQRCVITGEPVFSRVDEPIEAMFSPHATRLEFDTLSGETLASISLEEEPPEPLVGGRAELGRLIAELLSLGIDPYPRKADAVFEAYVSGDGEAAAEAGPFAALEKLRKPSS